ncbi:hypothetical protein DXG01_005009 [Tephrocybe rancida]|nr:hypothetical protein DXG01_005009 [Tephrocybe rancida]
MSEYWVSKKKYFCKYCDIYIADDAPSRQQHETGLRHKGNLDRFIRGLYKTGEKRKKDEDEEKRELARVEQAAQAAYAQDVAAGRARPGAGPPPVASTSTAPKKPAPKPSNPYVNYSTAASLGFSDPDAERIAAEAERRRTQGVAGEWEVVAIITPTLAASSDEDEKSDIKTGDTTTGVKREAETPIDEEDTRVYKLQKKGWGSGLGGGYDPDAIPVKLKKKEEVQVIPAVTEPTSTSTLATETSAGPTGVPKWTKIQWRKAGEAIPEVIASEPQVNPAEETIPNPPFTTPPLANQSDSLLPSAEETKHTPVQLEEAPPAPEPSSASGMFRKRKVPTGGNKGRRT